ncbi:unnamed protein product [Oppiella nova]|uniref:Cytochrome c oxidase assembly protein COX16 homolog, mitochondrial n=1 Tax=Oppiella nova TaxID=334625 RepID=A0A7R9M0K7_9ACAR|nr:unnamed protein product [Oppiella nova]CAG2168118.1 unnamed protein product [Oppiella nova]
MDCLSFRTGSHALDMLFSHRYNAYQVTDPCLYVVYVVQLFITGGSYVLKEFATIRYEISRHNKQLGVTPDLVKEMGFDVKNLKSLEEEYDSMVKTVDTDNWKNIRGPRPWEENTTEYKEMIERRISEEKTKRRI